MMMKLLSCTLLVASATAAQAQDWPQWRGVNRDGKVTGFKAPSAWPKELAQKWKTKIGDGVATPALVGEKLYAIAREDGNDVVRCLDATSGKEVWQEKYPQRAATGAAQGFPGPRSSPVVTDGRVITLGASGSLSCFDAASGKLNWRKTDFSNKLPRFFTSSSPIVVDGLCIVQLGGEDDGVMAAFDMASGEQKWKWVGDGTTYSSPVLFEIGGKKSIVAITSATIVGIDAADGKLLWETAFKAGYNACTPIVNGQTIIYSGGARGGKPSTKAIKIEKDGDKFAVKELWTNPDNGVQFNSPIVKNGLIFGLSASDNFFCLNADTGKTCWSAPKSGKTAAPAPAPAPGGPGGPGGRGRMGGGVGYGSIIDADPVLMALTPTMELIVFQPSDQEMKEIARFKVAASATYAYPVVSGNRLFVKDQDSIALWTIE